MSLRHENTQIHITHKIQISSQSYTNSEGHITGNEYSVGKGKEIKLSLLQAMEAY
jgi:hypothetical protein